METLFSLTLFSLFIPFLVGLGGSNMLLSDSSSPDVILKILLLSLMIISLLFVREKRIYLKNLSVYFIPSVIFLLILIYHYINSTHSSIEEFHFAKKEILRVAYFIVILVFGSLVRMKMKNYRFLIYQFVLFGIPLGLMAVRSAMIGNSVRRGMIVGEFVRAGGDLTATNNLAAALNITTFCAFIAFLIVKKRYQKIFCIVAALFSQAGRFATFSNGSLVGLVVSIFVSLYLFWKFDSAIYMRLWRIVIVFIVLLSAITIYSGKAEVLFSRFLGTDKTTGILVSVSSRRDQYEGLWNLIVHEPEKLLFGVGTANVHSALKTTQTLHNAYLLPLVTAGVSGFASFMFIWWLSLKNFYAAVKCSVGKRDDTILTAMVLATYIGYSVQILTVPYSTSTTLWFFFILANSFGTYWKQEAFSRNQSTTGAGYKAQHTPV